MLYFILNTNGLKIELTQFKVSFNETNDWFNAQFTTDYSFPFDVPIDYLKSVVDFDENATNQTTLFKGKLYKFGRIEDATFKIQEVLGKQASCVIFGGVSQFPGFDKKLSEFPLDVVEGINMKEYAKETIVKDYPETSFNFPMVHTDNYDSTSSEFNGFRKIINHFEDGDYVQNAIDELDEVDVINNIMQPFPYLMHVLQKIFQTAGYTLAGDILTIPDLQKALLCNKKNYFTSLVKTTIPFRQNTDQWDSLDLVKSGIQHVKFEHEITIEKKGNYILYGQVVSAVFKIQPFNNNMTDINVLIEQVGVSTVELYEYNVNGTDYDPTSAKKVKRVSKNVDLEFSAEAGDIIRITKIEPKRDSVPELLENYPEAFSLDIFPVRYLNPDDSPIISLLDKDYIDLKELVPEMTAEELVNEVRMLKNLDFTPNGSVVTMNFIDKNINRENCLDLSKYNVSNPLRTYDDELSFELFFSDEKKENNNSVYVTKSQVFESNYLTQKETIPIEINALAYPVIFRNNVSTAHQNDDEDSKLRLIYYSKIDDLEEDLPTCYSNDLMKMKNIYELYYKKWLTLRINSVKFNWNFIIPLHKYPHFNVKSILFYNKIFHVLSEKENELLLINNNQYLSITAKSESFH